MTKGDRRGTLRFSSTVREAEKVLSSSRRSENVCMEARQRRKKDLRSIRKPMENQVHGSARE